MTSDPHGQEAFVWVWLPGQTKPVIAGRLSVAGDDIVFNYAKSYLGRANAISLYDPELPLQEGVLPLTAGLRMPNCIRDAAPDAWGRRVILNHKLGKAGRGVDTAELDELTYLLESGSDRIGALDFQTSPTAYVARETAASSLDELLNAAAKVEKGIPLSPALDAALLHGSSIGGARPKALIVSNDIKYVAKFSSQSDVYSVVKAEYIAMRLAREAGIDAAAAHLEQAVGKDVLLVRRFDRERATDGWRRRAVVSALTLLGLDEMMARYASYDDLATIIRHRFHKPKETLKELFARILFNVICGNTDDHARNHAAFWDGKSLSLTPAYDICPQGRSGGEAHQAMLITANERNSQIATCLRAAPNFLLSVNEATAMAKQQIVTVCDRWSAICDEARLNEVDRSYLWRRQFLNPYALQGAPSELVDLLPA